MRVRVYRNARECVNRSAIALCAPWAASRLAGTHSPTGEAPRRSQRVVMLANEIRHAVLTCAFAHGMRVDLAGMRLPACRAFLAGVTLS